MPPMALDANVTASTNKAKARARSCPTPYVPKHQTYAASLGPSPLMERGTTVVNKASRTIAGRTATGSEIPRESARSEFIATKRMAEAIPTAVPQRTA
jgi:hypothetical protein